MRTLSLRGRATLLLAWPALACVAAGDGAPAGGGSAADSLAPAVAIVPAPDPLAALAADSAWILEELRFLSSDALEGRATGTGGAARARARLVRLLAGAGAKPAGGTFERPFRWARRGDTLQHRGVNLVGVVRGAELPGRAIVLSAHYDHVGVRDGEVYNGADDNASGAVGALALLRAVRARPLRHTLVVALFDAEEVGLRGARAFVADPPVPLDAIAVDLNLDMVARTAGVLWAGGAHHTPALRPVLEGVARRSPVELRLGHDAPGGPAGADWTGQSDHGAFHEAGIPWVYLGVEDHADVHRPTDDFERVRPGEYIDALRAALMVLLALDEALPLSPSPSPGPEPGS